ncbi:hypothetical protein SteCoe_19994 [Stentor coeruleus]|uniref:non-specific serine/threonine protein kinase n=1 Tax=Stentor coeruleus TaxID=5963 RepID=A0A1R2BT31_9CILI|nr:hypothetical protein SteCoe_19994 [Stentor coeruleus]
MSFFGSQCASEECKNEISALSRTRTCQTCRKAFCESCYYERERTLLSIKGFCLKCYTTINSRDDDEPLPDESYRIPSQIEVSRKLSNYLDPIFKDPFEFHKKISKLGKGNFSKVYKVQERGTNKEYALKFITDSADPNCTAPSEFLNTVLVPCESIVKSYALYKHEGKFYILQELMSTNLGIFLRKHYPLPENVGLYIMKEILKGLDFLHKNGKIHRDIKSENIFVNYEGKVKIGDFGTMAQLTQENMLRTTMAGTPLWLAPEVAMQSKYYTPADIWSLGILAIEIIDGRPPNENAGSLQELIKILKDNPEPRPKNQKYPKISEIIENILIKDANLRPKAHELLNSSYFDINEGEAVNFIRGRIYRGSD